MKGPGAKEKLGLEEGSYEMLVCACVEVLVRLRKGKGFCFESGAGFSGEPPKNKLIIILQNRGSAEAQLPSCFFCFLKPFLNLISVSFSVLHQFTVRSVFIFVHNSCDMRNLFLRCAVTSGVIFLSFAFCPLS